MKNEKMNVVGSFLIGILPLALLLILPNIIHEDTLTRAIESFLAIIPDDSTSTAAATSSISTKQRRRKNSITNGASLHSSLPKIQEELSSTNAAFINANTDNNQRDSKHTGASDTIINTAKNPDPTTKGKRSTTQQHHHHRHHRHNSNQNVQSNTKNIIKNHRQMSKSEKAYNIDKTIEILQTEYQHESSNFIKALNYADALRHRDLIIHDGGSIQKKSIKVYKHAIKLIKSQWKAIQSGDGRGDVRLSLQQLHKRYETVMEEAYLPNEQKSIHGLLVTAYCNLGKQYYMANMFEKSVEAYNSALKLEPKYIDALNSRGSAYVILGKYKDAGSDYMQVLSLDRGEVVTDVFNGLAKVLVAIGEENIAAENGYGWDDMVSVLSENIPRYEKMVESLQGNNNPEAIQGRTLISDKLKVMHLAMFSYHDHKTTDTKQAFYHLSTAYQYKMSNIPPYDKKHEQMKVQTIMQVFNKNFWPEGVGSISSKKIIFVVGFPRSGSTLLERVLGSHSNISGTGEDSIFNGMLDEIRNAIIEVSIQQSPIVIQNVVEHYAKKVEDLVVQRWLDIERQSTTDETDESLHSQQKHEPKVPMHFIDKMLTNYANIGFIHLLFPNALILHIFREPMDTLFSCYKHEFPPGNLDYTSDFHSLSHMYKNYRDIMTHWETVLPGRVMHIKYEDMVNDLPSIAKSIMSQTTDLEFEAQMLEFHKKKHAVNTHSSVQVRKGVYRESIESWKKYESYLKPLYRLVGEYANIEYPTSKKILSMKD